MIEGPSQRRFTALAMPRPGHPEGHAVLLVETNVPSRRERVLSRAEAEQVRAQLDAALRAFFVGESLGSPHASGARNPRASAAALRQAQDQSPLRPDGPEPGHDTPCGCSAPYPFRDHKTMAEV